MKTRTAYVASKNGKRYTVQVAYNVCCRLPLAKANRSLKGNKRSELQCLAFLCDMFVATYVASSLKSL